MFKLKDNTLIDLKVNGLNLPVEDGSLKKLIITASQDTFLPCIQLLIVDQSKFFDTTKSLYDGAVIDVTIGSSEEEYENYTFRVFSFPMQKVGAYTVYKISGYLDFPMYFTGSDNATLKGTSSQVLKTLASSMGFQSLDIDDSDDSQVWYQANKRNCVYAANIADCGYMDTSSFFRLAVQENGKFKYKNLSKFNPQDTDLYPLVSSLLNAKSNLTFYDSKSFIAPGFQNVTGAYAHSKTSFALNKEDSHSIETDSIELKQASAHLQVNKELYDSIENSRIEFAPIDVGNTHENYERAKYQNARAAKFYTNGVDLLFLSKSKLSLLDPFFAKLSVGPGNQGNTSLDDQRNGFYIGVAKSICIQNGTYFEVIRGLSTGPNSTTPNQEPLM